jgi:hypothetical protein
VTLAAAAPAPAPCSFAAKLAAARPFDSAAALHEAATRIWWNEARAPRGAAAKRGHASFGARALTRAALRAQVPAAGWLEAFAAHPRIGDVDGLRQKFAATAQWCARGAPVAPLRCALFRAPPCAPSA